MDFMELTIDAMTLSDQGIAHTDEGVVFVKGGVLGDTVIAAIDKKKKRYANAHVVEIVSYGAERIDRAPMPVDGRIFANLDYETEKRIKRDHVENTLRRIGRRDVTVPLYAGTPEHYRNKGTFLVRGGVPGHFRTGTHDFLPMEDGSLYDERILERVGRLAPVLGGGELTVRVNAKGRAMILVSRSIPVREDDPDLYYVEANGKTRHLFGEEPFMMELLGRELELPPGSFFQVNTAMAERLFRHAAKHIPTEGTVVELYAGIGAITLSMDTTASLYGVEIHPGAVAAANRNAERLARDARFLLGKSEDLFRDLPAPDLLIVDPPRAGLDAKLIDEILRREIPQILYISCDPASLARDLARLEAYEISDIAAYDLFPRTGHVEALTLLVRDSHSESK